jgi:hypothetical protein
MKYRWIRSPFPLTRTEKRFSEFLKWNVALGRRHFDALMHATPEMCLRDRCCHSSRRQKAIHLSLKRSQLLRKVLGALFVTIISLSLGIPHVMAGNFRGPFRLQDGLTFFLINRSGWAIRSDYRPESCAKHQFTLAYDGTSL